MTLNKFISNILLYIAEEYEIADAAAGCGWLRVGLLHTKHDVALVQMALSQCLLSLTLRTFVWTNWLRKTCHSFNLYCPTAYDCFRGSDQGVPMA